MLITMEMRVIAKKIRSALMEYLLEILIRGVIIEYDFMLLSYPSVQESR